MAKGDLTSSLKYRRLLIGLTIFHAMVNTLYLVRFFGALPPEAVVYGYVPWFMSFALPNAVFALLSWLLLYSLIKKRDVLSVVTGLLVSGGLIFHALISFMFGFYSGSFAALTTFNAIFEIFVYIYGMTLAAFYIAQFGSFLHNKSKLG